MSALERFDFDEEPEAPDEALAGALSSLITQGIVYTPMKTREGVTEYMIDRIPLTADELRHLHKEGALTREGIQRYLVNR